MVQILNNNYHHTLQGRSGEPFPSVTQDTARSERHATLSSPEIADQVYKLILVDRRIMGKIIVESLEIYKEIVWFIIHGQLSTRQRRNKLRYLNTMQKQYRVHTLP